LAGWWTEEVLGDGKVGGKIEFIFRTPTGDLKLTLRFSGYI